MFWGYNGRVLKCYNIKKRRENPSFSETKPHNYGLIILVL